MASLNKVMIIGNLGRDPEVSYTPAGMAIAKLAIATTDVWNDKSTGEKRERTEWHRITFFGKQAETVGRYLSKGRQIYVEGRLQTSSYEKDGITRYSTDIIASGFQFLGNKNEGASQGGGFQQQNNGFQGGGQGGGFQNQNNAGFQNNAAPQQQAGGFSNNPTPQNDGGFQQNAGGFSQNPPPADGFGGDQGFQNPPDDDIPF